MSDLAQAIIDLGKAAEVRNHARRDLIESTATVAGAIAKQLRRGDHVSFRAGEGPGPLVTYRVERFRDNSYVTFAGGEMKTITVLCRGVALLQSIQGKLFSPDHEEGGDFHLATPAERIRFADEAPMVVDAFAELVRREAAVFAETAKKAAKLTVR
jgi:hypothetical protein